MVEPRLMKRKILALLMCATVFSYGQTELMWEKHISSYYEKIAIDTENNICTYGNYSYSTPSFDVDPGPGILDLDDTTISNCFIQKLDQNGDMIWTKTLHGQNLEIEALVTDASNNIYLAGHFMDTIDFDPGPGVFFLSTNTMQDLFVLKLTSAGEFSWAKRFGGASHDFVTCIETDAAENVLVGGYYKDSLIAYSITDTFIVHTSAITDEDAFLVKMDADGEAKWIYTFGSNLGSADAIESVATDDDLNVYITGQFMWTVDFDPGPGVQNYTSVAGTDACNIKLDSEGNLVWCQVINANGGGAGTYVKVDAANDVIFCGLFRDSVDFNPGAGEYFLESDSHSGDYYLQKLSGDGNFIWARRFGNYSDEYGGFVVDSDSENSLLIGGNFMDSMDLNPGPGIAMVHAHDSVAIIYFDPYFVKLDKDGNYVWGGTAGGHQYDAAVSVAVDNAGNVVASLYGQWYFDVDPTEDSLFLDPGAPTYLYGCIIKLERDILFNAVEEDPFSNDMMLYPNPTRGMIFMTSKNPEAVYEITVRNSLGEIVQSYQHITFPVNLELDGEPGFYFVEVISSTGIRTFKVIKTN